MTFLHRPFNLPGNRGSHGGLATNSEMKSHPNNFQAWTPWYITAKCSPSLLVQKFSHNVLGKWPIDGNEIALFEKFTPVRLYFFISSLYISITNFPSPAKWELAKHFFPYKIYFKGQVKIKKIQIKRNKNKFLK